MGHIYIGCQCVSPCKVFPDWVGVALRPKNTLAVAVELEEDRDSTTTGLKARLQAPAVLQTRRTHARRLVHRAFATIQAWSGCMRFVGTSTCQPTMFFVKSESLEF